MARLKEDLAKRLSRIKMTPEKIGVLYKAGFTDEQVAKFFELSRTALKRWKKLDELRAPLKDWKKKADLKVEKTLYQRATGYKVKEVTYEKVKAGALGITLSESEISGITHQDTYKTKIVIKEIPPEVTAQIFWLKNRQPEVWRDKHDYEHSGEIKLTKEEKIARINRLAELGIPRG